MEDKTIAIYSIIKDILKAIGHYEDKRRDMSDAEVITTAIVSTMFFSGNYEWVVANPRRWHWWQHLARYWYGAGLCIGLTLLLTLPGLIIVNDFLLDINERIYKRPSL